MKVFQRNTELLWGSCRDVMVVPTGIARPARGWRRLAISGPPVRMDRFVRFA